MAHEGKGNTLDAALEDAWTKVPKDDKGKWHTVQEIEVKGENPINTYRVVLDLRR